jgi:UDP-N-acetyl-D-galactosamine dehydrogenase
VETVAVIGLGYVGLPLAVAFGRIMPTTGFDLHREKIDRLLQAKDPADEVGEEEIRAASHLNFTADPGEIGDADYHIVAVPTPVDAARRPDFGPLKDATRLVGRHLKKGALVIYESTVYPGATEEVCIPLLQEVSGLTWKRDFHVGYSPERINPGDRKHQLHNVVKVVAGDDEGSLERVARLYERVVEAGVHRVSSIRCAEAAKVIENTQRDLNIALMNELAIIFGRLGIDTTEVLEAAGTKWNFLPFRPGLVGGHCIGVDPYYLTYKAEMMDYHPQVIIAGRRINDGMGKYVVEQTIKQMIRNGINIKGAKVAVLGITFKEDCSDMRNSRVFDVLSELRSYGVNVFVHDPLVDPALAQERYGVSLTIWRDLPVCDAMIVAVAHRQFRNLPPEQLMSRLDRPSCLIDVKSVIDQRPYREAGIGVWRL